MRLPPVEDRTLIEVFICGACGKRYENRPKRHPTSCAVLHSPGSCCHHGQIELSDQQYRIVTRGPEVESELSACLAYFAEREEAELVEGEMVPNEAMRRAEAIRTLLGEGDR